MVASSTNFMVWTLRKKGLQEKHLYPYCKAKSPACWQGFYLSEPRSYSEAIIETVRFFCRPLMLNLTCPSTRAYRVWSLPKPTLVPGGNCVPRWRTMIEPAEME